MTKYIGQFMEVTGLKLKKLPIKGEFGRKVNTQLATPICKPPEKVASARRKAKGKAYVPFPRQRGKMCTIPINPHPTKPRRHAGDPVSDRGHPASPQTHGNLSPWATARPLNFKVCSWSVLDGSLFEAAQTKMVSCWPWQSG